MIAAPPGTSLPAATQGEVAPVPRRSVRSPDIEQSLLAEQVEFTVSRQEDHRPAVFRFEARSFAVLGNTQIRIECVRLCAAPFAWESKVVEEPAGALVYGEVKEGTLVLTQWLGGTYDWVRLYAVGTASVRVLLEATTRDGVQLKPTESGYPTITVTPQTPGTQRVGERVPLIRYSWDGARQIYVSSRQTR
jgi:hypothetical protein